MANIIFSEAPGIADSIYGNSQAPIRMFLEKRAEAFESKSLIPELYNVEPSENWAEKMTTMTAMDDFEPVGENGAYPMVGTEEGYSRTLEHMVWKSSFAISREIIDDAKAMDLRSKPQGFITAYYRTREKFGARLLAAAASSSTLTMGRRKFSTLAADGKRLFAADHPCKVKSNTQSNLYSNAFTAANLALVETAMQSYKGDNYEQLDVVPNTIIIPNNGALKAAVFAAIGADKDPTTANNGFNFLFGRWHVMVWPYLNDSWGDNPYWMLADLNYNKEYGTAVWFDRKKLEVVSAIADNDANMWKGYARFIGGFNDWRGLCLCGVSGGTTLA